MFTKSLGFLLAFILCTTIFASTSFAAALKPDLTPHSMGLSSLKTPTSKTVLPVKVIIKNKGKKASPRSSVIVALSKDGALGAGDLIISRTALLPIATGKVRQVVAKTVLPRITKVTSYRILICVDVPSRIREVNERNNCKAAGEKLTVYPASMSDEQTVAMMNVVTSSAMTLDPATYCAAHTARSQQELLDQIAQAGEGTFATCTEAFTAMKAKYGDEPFTPTVYAGAYVSYAVGVGKIILVKNLMMKEVFGKSDTYETITETQILLQQPDGSWLIDSEDEISSSGGGASF